MSGGNDNNALADIVVVLVGTDGSENAGSVARLAGNFGCALRFVDVHAELACKDAYKMAHPMEAFLDEAPRLASLDEAVADCAIVVGTSGKIVRPGGVPTLNVPLASSLLRGNGERVALVFGNERTGLSVTDAARCERLVRLPTPGPAESFNLASSVAVTLTLFHAALAETRERASTSDRGALVHTFETQLMARGFYKGRSPAGFRPRLEELVGKMDLSPRDVELLAQMLRALGGTPVSSP